MDVRGSVESSLPPTPSTLASLRVSTDTWSAANWPDSPALPPALPSSAPSGRGGSTSSPWSSQQLLAAELEARNQALRQLLASSDNGS